MNYIGLSARPANILLLPRVENPPPNVTDKLQFTHTIRYRA